MAYIVPSDIPKTCAECAFCACKFSFPQWATDRGDLCGKQGFYCSLDTQNPRRVMVVDFGDKTGKMGWCPLREVVWCNACRFNVANIDDDPLDETDYSDVTCSYFMTDGMCRDDYCSRGERYHADANSRNTP